MTFALPIALTLTALALPIIALYILKVRLRRVPVSTNLFWKQIYEEKPPRSIWQHFRHLSSLLLQLLMLLLLVLAISDPYFSWQLLQARRVVVVIDNSASMSAADVSPSRFDAAQAAARSIVEGLRFRDEMALVVAGSTPEVAVGMTGHSPTLRAAIDAVRVSDNPTNLKDAIDLGRQLTGKHPHGQIIVLTDGAVDKSQVDSASASASAANDANGAADAKADSAVPESVAFESPVETSKLSPASHGVSVEFQILATDVGNVGITQLQVRRSLIDPLGYEILTSVRNASSQAISCRLELSLDEIPIDVIPLSLKAEELWTRSFEKTSLEGGRVKAVLTQIERADQDSASLNPGNSVSMKDSAQLDMLVNDNTAWALLPERKTQRVLIVSPGNVFLQKVFEANPLVEVVTRKDLPAEGEWPSDSIIVLHGAVPETLPNGSLFVIDPVGNCDQWDVNGPIENPIVTDQDTTSPLMNHIRLDNVVVPEAKQLTFKSPVHALARTLNGEVIYSDVRRSDGKCLVLSINLDRSDLAFRTAFPIMVANALNWFAGTTGELQPAMASGAVVPVRLEIDTATSRQLKLKSPSGRLLPVAVSETQQRSSGDVAAIAFDDSTPPNMTFTAANADSPTVSLGPLDEIGVWSVERVTVPDAADEAESSAEFSTDSPAGARTDEVLTEIAVNLANERETDLRPLDELDETSQLASVTAGWLSRPFWYYLIFAALMLTCGEWFLYQRRFIS